MTDSKNSAASILNRRRLPRIPKGLANVLLGVLCLSIGFGICLRLIPQAEQDALDSESDTVRDAAIAQVLQDVEVADSQGVVQPTLSYADELLASGDPTAALVAYDQVLGPDQGSQSTHYRRALCHELLGDRDRAIRVYRGILKKSDPGGVAVASQLGIARIRDAAGDRKQALELLYSILLTSGDTPRDSVLHRLAYVATKQVVSHVVPAYGEGGILAPDWPEDIQRLIDLPIALENLGVSSTRERNGVRVRSRTQADPVSIRVSVRVENANVEQLISELLTRSDLEVRWDSPLGPSRHLELVDVADVDLATLLDALLDPVGRTWISEGETIRIVSEIALSQNILEKLRVARAEQYCHNALTLFPDHARSVRTYYSLGNLAFHIGEYDRANSFYEQILKSSRKAEVLGATSFNHAKSLRRLESLADASAAFIDVVDYARGEPIEAIAYLYLGEIALETGALDEAVKHLVRAVSLATTTDLRQVAAVTLASAYLMSDNPLAANMTLMDHRDILRNSPHHGNSWFLSSLARYRAASNATEQFHRGRDLTSTLSEVTPERFFTSAGVALFGQAYSEIGIASEMQAIYEQMIQQSGMTRSRQQAMLRLADSYVEEGDVHRGRVLYQKLVNGKDPSASQHSRLKLAELDWLSGQEEVCLEHCRLLIDSGTDKEIKRRALEIMGRVYESRSDHYRASLCFAGMVPHIATDSSQPNSQY